jgi:DNA repair protein SbcD/Mre11
MADRIRILHTADWHLGKRLRHFPLLDEQAVLVDQVIEIAARERPDAAVIAGDIFDVAVPGVDALAVWAGALDRLVALGIPTLVISGNHDQAERLGHLASLSERAGVAVRCSLADVTRPLLVGSVALYGLPFTRPARVRAAFGLSTDEVPEGDDAAALRAVGARVLEHHRREHPERLAVAVAHCFVDGAGPEDEGEDAICVGGTAALGAAVFDGFAYVALGHIHGRRSLGEGRVRYAGSLYPTSFAEAGHEKSVSIVTLDSSGVQVDEVPLRLPRRVRRIEGLRFDEVLSRAPLEDAADRDAYVLVRVTDTEPIEAALPRLREHYPRALLELATYDGGSGDIAEAVDLEALDPREVTLEFLRDRTGQDPSDLQREVLDAALRFVDEVDELDDERDEEPDEVMA